MESTDNEWKLFVIGIPPFLSLSLSLSNKKKRHLLEAAHGFDGFVAPKETLPI